MSRRDYLLRVVVEGVDKASSALKNVRRRVVETSREVERASASFAEFSSSLRRIGEIAGGVVAGLIGFNILDQISDLIRDGVRAFAEFEAESIKLASLSREAGQDIDLLAQSFRIVASAASRDYAVSAEQAMAALQSLIKAGLSGEDAINALGAAIQMARLEMVDFQTAGNNLVQVMSQFGVSGAEAARVVDTLVNASRLGIGTANDFAQGLANCGASARNLGLSLEDTTTWLVILERRFGSAQEAGTHLNRFLLELYEIAEKLGVPIRDANGALRDTNEVILDVIERARELGGDFKNLQDRLTGVDMRALKALSTFTQMTESFQALREEIGRQGSTWEAYRRWLETTQGRFAAMAAEVDRMKRRIGESTSSIATYLGNAFLPAVETVFASWRGIVAHAVGDVAGNLESAIEVQMRLGRIAEEQADAWIMSYVEMGKITEQEALRIAEHLGIMGEGIRKLVQEATKAGEEVPERFRTLADSSRELEDQVKITAEAVVSLGKKFKLNADEAVNLANQILGLNLTWDEHDQLVKQLVQDYGLTEDQARRLVEAMAREAEEAKRAAEAQKAHDEALKKLQSTLSRLAEYGMVLGPFHQAIQDINEALAVLGAQAPPNLYNLLSTLQELNNQFIQLEIASKNIAAAQQVVSVGLSYFNTLRSIQNALIADEIALHEQRLAQLEEELAQEEAKKVVDEARIERLKQQIELEKQHIENLRQSAALTVQQMISQERLTAIQQTLALVSQVVSLQQTAMRLAMMGANDAANMFSNTAMALVDALKDGVITEQEMKSILEALGVTFDETGKPIINLTGIMEGFRQKVEETKNKVEDFRSTLMSLDGLTVHTYHYHHKITVYETRKGGGGGGVRRAPTPEEAEKLYESYTAAPLGEYLHGFQRGVWNVPRNMVAYLHRGEMVLPRRVAEWFRRGGFSRNIVVNVNVNANISGDRDVDELARLISRKIVSNLRVMA